MNFVAYWINIIDISTMAGTDRIQNKMSPK